MERQDDIIVIIKEFLSLLGVSVDTVEIIETPAHPLYTISTPDSGLLIGRDGENLRALNHILKKIVEQKLGDKATRFLLDVNGYHRRRIDELEKKVKMLAERVRLFRSEVEMEPMNAYERMVIHSLFSEDSDIATESRGEGRFRHIVIRYKKPDEDSHSPSPPEEF